MSDTCMHAWFSTFLFCYWPGSDFGISTAWVMANDDWSVLYMGFDGWKIPMSVPCSNSKRN
jgi:hypothetical protein